MRNAECGLRNAECGIQEPGARSQEPGVSIGSDDCVCPKGTGVRLRVRNNNGLKVLIGQKHWSVRS